MGRPRCRLTAVPPDLAPVLTGKFREAPGRIQQRNGAVAARIQWLKQEIPRNFESLALNFLDFLAVFRHNPGLTTSPARALGYIPWASLFAAPSGDISSSPPKRAKILPGGCRNLRRPFDYTLAPTAPESLDPRDRMTTLGADQLRLATRLPPRRRAISCVYVAS